MAGGSGGCGPLKARRWSGWSPPCAMTGGGAPCGDIPAGTIGAAPAMPGGTGGLPCAMVWAMVSRTFTGTFGMP